MQTKKKGFIVHENSYEQVSLLSYEDRGRLFTAMFEYHKNGVIPKDFPPLLAMAFVGIRQAMDQDRLEYDRRCEISRENGKKGGRPKKENLKKPKKADMDMDMGMDMGMGMDMDMGMDMEMEADRAPLSSDGSADSVCVRRLSEQEKEDLISFSCSYFPKKLENSYG